MEGNLDSYGLPIIMLEVAGRQWKATIDTGFNGDLELPHDLFNRLRPRFVASGHSFLAGNQMIEEDVYEVTFPFDGELIGALATFVSGGGILIGTHLLRKHSLYIDFPTDRVEIERSI